MRVFRREPTGSLIADPAAWIEVAAPHPSTITLTEGLLAQVHDLDDLRCLSQDGIYDEAVAQAACLLSAVTEAVIHGHTGGALADAARHADCDLNEVAAAACWVTLNYPDHRVVILDLDAALAQDTAEKVALMPNVTIVDIGVSGASYDGGRVVPVDDYAGEAINAIDLAVSMHPDLVIASLGIEGIPAAAAAARDLHLAKACATAEIPVAFVVGDAPGRSADAVARRQRAIETFAAVC